MQIVLHDIRYSMPFSVLTSIVTACSYSHGSIMQNEVLFDTTLTRGYFDRAHPLQNQGEREVTIIDIPEIDATDFIKSFMHTKYDAVGLLLWPFRIQSKDKYYCFEAVVECMRFYGIDINPENKPVDGDMIFTYFNDRGYKCYRTQSKNIDYSWFSK